MSRGDSGSDSEPTTDGPRRLTDEEYLDLVDEVEPEELDLDVGEFTEIDDTVGVRKVENGIEIWELNARFLASDALPN